MNFFNFSSFAGKFGLILSLTFLSFGNISAQKFNCADCHDNMIKGSVHDGVIECADCHSDVVNEDHIDKGAKKVQCATCHDDIAKLVKTDIHHRLKTLVKNPPDCITCHGGHTVKAVADIKNKTKEICAKCHKDGNVSLTAPYHSAQLSSSKCFDCHDDDHQQSELVKSVHNGLECADCHDYEAKNLTTHSDGMNRMQRADCFKCHADVAKQYKESIHGISLSQGIDEAAMCWDCHGTHNIVPVKNEDSPVYPKNIAKTCGTCHDNPEFVKKFAWSIKNPETLYSNSVHGKLVEEGRLDVATCVTCHGSHDIKNRVQPGSSISSFNLPETCGKCHREIADQYEQSIHWLRAKQGVREAPVCNDCHNEHGIQAVNLINKRDEVRKLQERTCVVCHEDPRLAERYDISGGQARQYQDSYHGLAVMRGDKDAAMCVDCHSVHKILPASHPESTVNPNNVVNTCRKCHPEATPVFAKSYSHKAVNAEAQKVQNFVSNIYFWLIITVIGGMILHNLLIYFYELRAKRKKMLGEITIPRFTKNEVVQHILLLSSFLTLAITGFALKFSQSGWAELLLQLGMDEPVRQNIHRGAAVILMTTGIYHILYMVFTARGRELLAAIFPKVSDIHEAADNILYYLRIKKKRPEFDAYDYTEKAEYWALIWGTIVMGATGLILWFPTLVGDWAPVWLIKVSEIIHFYEAILATLAIVVWHWFFVIFHPKEYPMSFAWIDGKMTLNHYRHHHDRHFKRVVVEWLEMKSGRRDEKKLSNSTKLFTSTLKNNNLDPDEVIQNELDNDFELRRWVDEKLSRNTNNK